MTGETYPVDDLVLTEEQAKTVTFAYLRNHAPPSPESAFGVEPEEDNFWSERFGMTRPYNSGIDRDIRNVAGIIVEARLASDAGRERVPSYLDDIADRLDLPYDYVELILQMLVDLRYPREQGQDPYVFPSPFTYGTSPRGLFVDNLKNARKFLEEFDEHLRRAWGEGET